jgi:hypothetical protein
MTTHTKPEGVAAPGRPPAGPGTAPTRAQRLAQDAAEAAEVRAYQTDPDVVACGWRRSGHRWTGCAGRESCSGWRSP